MLIIYPNMQLLYDSHATIGISCMLRDIGIDHAALPADVRKIIQRRNNGTKVTNILRCAVPSVIKSAIPVLDKLSLNTVITRIITENHINTNTTIFPTQIIHHTLTLSDDITTAYANGYMIVNGTCIVVRKKFKNAINKGFCPRKIMGRYASDANLQSCHAIEELVTSQHITTFAPFAQSLHKVTITTESYKNINNKIFANCTNITELDITYASNLTSCDPFAKSLRKLTIRRHSGLTDESLSNCHNITELNIMYNQLITTCNPFAKSLCILNAKDCLMGDYGLVQCNALTKLVACNNSRITTCAPFATTLEILYATWECGIGDDGLHGCVSLRELYIHHNKNITRVPNLLSLEILHIENDKVFCIKSNTTFDIKCLKLCKHLHNFFADNINNISLSAHQIPMVNLRTLSACHRNCVINDDALQLCTSIEVLYAMDNENITTCAPFAKTLRTLYATSNCGICDDGLRMCTAITKLDATCNNKITTCAPFAKTLRILILRRWSGVQNKGLELCTAIEELNVSQNEHITSCTPFAASLKILYAESYTCGMTDRALRECTSLQELYADDNPNISTCAPFAKFIRKLSAQGWCGIDNSGLRKCNSIVELNASGNKKITSCIPFADSLIRLSARGLCGICDKDLYPCKWIEYVSFDGNDKITKEINTATYY